ncbi:MAG: polymer-forming cytoskeletal protein [Candidatus Omnitrophota bacterium]
MALRNKKHPGHHQPEDKVLDVDASMQGSLCFKDPVHLRINGKFDGILETRGVLTITERATVNARITGDNIIISGYVKGEIFAREKVALSPPALVEGVIKTARLNVAEGAKFEGNCHMLDDTLDVEDLARYLDVDAKSVVNWAEEGKIPAEKRGDKWKFERGKIDGWVASGAIKQ